MLKKMNLPNKITLLRIILVPIFVVFMCLPIEWVWPIWVGFGVYALAAFTDFLDGYISRKKNIVTKFGKIMDPLADKLLVSSGFVMLAALGVIPGWIAVIVIFRDLFVNALRMFGAEQKSDLGAILSGKIKTIFTLIGVLLGILSLTLPSLYKYGAFIQISDGMKPLELMVNIGLTVAMSVAVIATVWSLIDYFIKFKKDINVEE